MSEEQFDDILDALNRISVKLNKLEKLEEIANILRITEQPNIDKRKLEILSKSHFRQEVFNLCDGTHTVSEISRAVGKSISQVSQAIAHMQQAGILTEQRRGSLKYYKGVV